MKIILTEIDREHWKFILYQSKELDLFCEFVYSPQSFVDLMMLIKLTSEEKNKYKNNREYLSNMANEVNNNYKKYFQRAEKKEN